MTKKANYLSDTIKLLNSYGWIADNTESYNAFNNKRKDLFSFCDVLAVNYRFKTTAAIQITSYANKSSRFKKIIDSIQACVWLLAGNKIFIIYWKEEGKKLIPNIQNVSLEHYHSFLVERAKSFVDTIKTINKITDRTLLSVALPDLAFPCCDYKCQ